MSNRTFGPRRPVALAGPPPPPPLPCRAYAVGLDPNPPTQLHSPGRAVVIHGPPDPQTVGGFRRTYVSRGEDGPPYGGSVRQSRQATPGQDLPPLPTNSRGDDAPPFGGSVSHPPPAFQTTPQPVPPPVVARQSPFPVGEGFVRTVAGPKDYVPVPRSVVASGEERRPAEGSAWAFRPRLKQEVMPGRPVVVLGMGTMPELAQVIQPWATVRGGHVPPVEVADPAPVFHVLPRIRFCSPVRPT